MTARTPKALLRALDRAGLLPLIDLPRATITVTAGRDGTRHARWGCFGFSPPPDQRKEEVSFLAALSGERFCAEDACGKRLADVGSGSDTTSDVMALLALDTLARSVFRFVAKQGASTVPGKAVKFRTQLGTHQMRLNKVGQSSEPALREAGERGQAMIREALAALARLDTTPQMRAKVAGRVEAEMLPSRFRGRMRLDAEPVLAGVVNVVSPARKVQEVLDAYTIGGNRPSAVLSCPRFVADYLHRFYDVGSTRSLVLLTVPARDLDEDHQRSAARLWDPHGTGPLADLSAAVEAARMTLAPAAIESDGAD